MVRKQYFVNFRVFVVNKADWLNANYFQNWRLRCFFFFFSVCVKRFRVFFNNATNKKITVFVKHHDNKWRRLQIIRIYTHHDELLLISNRTHIMGEWPLQRNFSFDSFRSSSRFTKIVQISIIACALLNAIKTQFIYRAYTYKEYII